MSTTIAVSPDGGCNVTDLHPAEDPVVRKTGLGGSDMAAVLGVSPYRNIMDVWLEKTGRVEPFEGNVATKLGSQLEQIVADEYAHEHGVKLQRKNITARHKVDDWAFAHIDRKIVGERAAVEIKTTIDGRGWGDPYTDQVPIHILPQVHHQLWVEDLETVDVAVWFLHRWNVQYYRVFRTPQWDDVLANAGNAFWRHHVITDTPPQVRYDHPGAIESLRKHYGVDVSKVVTLPDRAMALHEARKALLERRRQCDEGADALKAEIMDLMAGAWVGLLPDGSCYRQQTQERTGYTVEPSTVTDFRYMKNPPKGAISE